MEADCPICNSPTQSPGFCGSCAGLFRWFRGYFAHVPDLPEQITPETRFVEDLGTDSLDWMSWPMEAEVKLGVQLTDWQYERTRTVGQFIRALRAAGAVWPEDLEVKLRPRPRCWNLFAWDVAKIERRPG